MKARQLTARTFMVGPVLDADGAAVTDCVVGDFKISKNGAAPAALNGSATLTHRHTGHYSLALTASDLDTVGTAQVTIDDTTNACPMLNISVVEEAVYDRDDAASATGRVTIASDGLDLVILESDISASASLTDDAGTQLTTINARQGLALGLSALAGVVSGGGTSAITFKATAKPAGNTRILTAASDVDGNRPTITIKVPT